jgi:putative tryptophan/tyrosine transport system substrate-binding protein
MRRRRFIASLGSAAVAWPLAARAQQPQMPVIGFLDPRSPDAMIDRLRGFRRGLKETDYIEEENVTVAYRWAENLVDRLSPLAADLVHRKVAMIIASGGPGVALAAKAATTTIPVLFLTADDPVELVLSPASLDRAVT